MAKLAKAVPNPSEPGKGERAITRHLNVPNPSIIHAVKKGRNRHKIFPRYRDTIKRSPGGEYSKHVLLNATAP